MLRYFHARDAQILCFKRSELNYASLAWDVITEARYYTCTCSAFAWSVRTLRLYSLAVCVLLLLYYYAYGTRTYMLVKSNTFGVVNSRSLTRVYENKIARKSSHNLFTLGTYRSGDCAECELLALCSSVRLCSLISSKIRIKSARTVLLLTSLFLKQISCKYEGSTALAHLTCCASQ